MAARPVPGLILHLSLIAIVLPWAQSLPVTECQLLDSSNTEYILQNDVSSDGTCFAVKGNNITLNLNGQTIRFYNPEPLDYSFGIICHPSYVPPGRPSGWVGGGTGLKIINGAIIQASQDTMRADTSYGTMSHAIYARSCNGMTLSNLTVTANSRYDATPVRLRSVRDATIQGISFFNNVQNITNRHYPGQSSLLIEAGSGSYSIYNVSIIGGPHKGMDISGSFDSCDIHHNSISHNQRYVNGYAFAVSGSNIDIRHNTVIPTAGRGIHLTGDRINFHHNYLDLRLGPVTDHYSTNDYHSIYTNVHGVKIEGGTNCKVYSNTVIASQPAERFAPPTPLNIDAPANNANNEIFNNNFTAVTYAGTASGETGYGNFATYASGIYIYRCGTSPGSIHNNLFYTNDRAVWKKDYLCSGFDIYGNRFIRLPDSTANSRAIIYNSASGHVNYTDNAFVGFAPDDITHSSGTTHNMDFMLGLRAVDSLGDPVAYPGIRIESAKGLVFEGMGDANGELFLIARMHTLSSGTFDMHNPHIIEYAGTEFSVVMDSSKFVVLSPEGAAEHAKCGHGLLSVPCMCGQALLDSGYCCFDRASFAACPDFGALACTEQHGTPCSMAVSLCSGGQFVFSADLGMDCCTGTCSPKNIPCHDADTAEPYGTISMQELRAYIARWHSGSTTSLASLIDAVHKWKHGCQ